MVELEVDIVGHHQVHESVAVVISESRTNRHATVRNTGFRGDIRERAIPIVAKQNISAETRQVQIWPAVSRRKYSDRKSTRLNSSHTVISYAVFCLKKKKKKKKREKT